MKIYEKLLIKLEVLAREVALLSTKISDSESGADISSLTQEVSALSEKVSTLETSVSSQAEQLSSLNTSLSSQSEQLSKISDTVSAQEEEISSLSQDLSTLSQDLSTLSTSIDEQSSSIETLTQKVEEQGDTLSSQSEQIATLQEQITSAAITTVDTLFDMDSSDEAINLGYTSTGLLLKSTVDTDFSGYSYLRVYGVLNSLPAYTEIYLNPRKGTSYTLWAVNSTGKIYYTLKIIINSGCTKIYPSYASKISFATDGTATVTTYASSDDSSAFYLTKIEGVV